MPSYGRAFGHCQQVSDPVTDIAVLSTLQTPLTSIPMLLFAVGASLAGLLGTWFGRRHMIQMACGLCILSAAGMLGTGGSFLNYMVGKRIGGIGIGQLQAVAIVYDSECTSPSKR
ncbi:uncharacterized protein A1O9_08463 [Exophiala aquamarina CBS 119918]|uniref:Major facilitator superfamily (MFS) profile domain-containing protein n=1 Tax=Exophiala aquamarina CBS 119918 TaxID=1182545 RepID=A0A072P8W4_9EURO|nr:uncharacterized protein A1O9_08463 [Exophiala aquamarina CBS 119918]KEF55713.1 hypothetical protein A1O9_08463 [Exophiala aquamarina CBS 119918]